MRGFADTRRERTTLLKETMQLMRQYGIVHDPEFGADPVNRVVPAEDIRGQTVIHDLRQFEADVREAARLFGKPVPPVAAFDAEKTAENVFAWVYACPSSGFLGQWASGENLTFGTLANRSKPAETQASSRYHPLRSHH
jgi:hypothetical protein